MFNLKSIATHLNRRRILLGGSVGAAGTLLTLGTSSPALAANSPASHWGTFTQHGTLADCQHFGGEALKSIGCKIWDSGKYFVVGMSGSVSASVTLVPLDLYDTYVIVIANSSDFDTAAKARSDIRSYIQRSVPVPYGNDSVGKPASN